MKYKIWIIYCLCLCGCERAIEKPSKLPPLVTGFQVTPQTIAVTATFVGVAKSSHPVEIRSRVSGYLLSINYEEGSHVEPEDLLFQIDPTPFEASLQEAIGTLARAEADLWRARRSLARLEPLLTKNAVSQKEVDDATAAVLSGEGEVLSAQGNVRQAEINLSYTKIRSPIKGWSSRAALREGALISQSMSVLTEISVIDPIWVVFTIADNDRLQAIEDVKKKTLELLPREDYDVELTFSDGTLFPHRGKVNFIAPILDSATGALVVRATFPNPEGVLLPGQFVQATVLGAKRPEALMVPKQSVGRGENGEFVYVIDRNNIVSLRNIQVGEWYEDYWIVDAGLLPGELVVVDGINKVTPGMQVTLQTIEH